MTTVRLNLARTAFLFVLLLTPGNVDIDIDIDIEPDPGRPQLPASIPRHFTLWVYED